MEWMAAMNREARLRSARNEKARIRRREKREREALLDRAELLMKIAASYDGSGDHAEALELWAKVIEKLSFARRAAVSLRVRREAEGMLDEASDRMRECEGRIVDSDQSEGR